MFARLKDSLPVGVFAAVLLGMAAITLGEGPDGLGRLPFVLTAVVLLAAWCSTWREWQQKRGEQSDDEQRESEL